jgi:uncharacterized protein (TIGR01777 family)
MRVAITGASGLLGQILVRALNSRGDEVVSLVRKRPQGDNERLWDPTAGRIAGPGLEDVDAVVNLAGAPIVRRKWTTPILEEIRQSRVMSTLTVVDALEPDGRCQMLVNASAVGYYGLGRGSEILTSESGSGEGFLAEVVREWEAAAEHAPIPTALIRTGNVLTRSGGFLGPQRMLFQLGLGGRMGSGRQYVPWIHIYDWVMAVLFVLDNSITGPVNVTAPNPVSNAEFTRVFADSLGRPPLGVPVPEWLLRLGVGQQMRNELLMVSLRVVPDTLLDRGFKFRFPKLADALADLSPAKSKRSAG